MSETEDIVVKAVTNVLTGKTTIDGKECSSLFMPQENREIIVAEMVLNELHRSMKKYPLFNSPHEGISVLREEFEELWDEVKKRVPDDENMRTEAIQVAAMAMKFVLSMERWGNSGQV